MNENETMITGNRPNKMNKKVKETQRLYNVTII